VPKTETNNDICSYTITTKTVPELVKEAVAAAIMGFSPEDDPYLCLTEDVWKLVVVRK
jgi:hypothetical protein